MLAKLFFVLALSSVIGDGGDVDDMIMKARIAVGDKNYPLAENVLQTLLEDENSMTFSQHANVLYSILELSYITKDYGDSVVYAKRLVALLKNKEGYEDVYNRIIHRLCISEDWKATRESFLDTCNQ
ncbi:hypothetical protein [Rheinheimera sp. NSM]|uniref:hypothetical protein n=1 Tax=Rheinheimera sp. NSM TaxID=3457884 RepID=UPI004037345F